LVDTRRNILGHVADTELCCKRLVFFGYSAGVTKS
jgi:hypothetical protein